MKDGIKQWFRQLFCSHDFGHEAQGWTPLPLSAWDYDYERGPIVAPRRITHFNQFVCIKCGIIQTLYKIEN